ncbi:hypothetical protein QJQ45_000261 [Haematococcus lacustris]|nr:hypothetical protein QJQ45_000261 [Haematococcus lacustris]
MLSDTLQRFPGIGSGVYLRLDRNRRRAMRLVCKQLRAAIDVSVSGLGISSIGSDDPDKVISLTMPQLRSLDVNCLMDVAACRAWQRLPHLSSLKLALTYASGAAAATPHLKGLEHITSLSIHSRDLAALDCPQLQTLAVRQLQVDCAASLHACAKGILQHCCGVYDMFTYDHGQEFKAAALNAGVRQLGPPPSASVLLEALAPWQPRSGKAIEELGLWRLPDVTHEALKWLPVNIKSLCFQECHLLPGALSSVATRLTQQTCLDLTSSPVALAELQLLAARAQQDLASDSLPLLATLPQLADLKLQSCPLQISSQLSHCLFQHLTALSVCHIHSRDLAALECPQLQTLAVRQLLGSSSWCWGAASGPAPLNLSAAGGTGTMAAASGIAIEELGLWHLSDVTREALEWLPVNIKSLQLGSCHLLPGALSSVATRLTQLTCLDLTSPPVALAELQLLAARAQQGALLTLQPCLPCHVMSVTHASVALAELQLLAARAQQGALLTVYIPIALSQEDVALLTRQRHAPLGNAAARVAALQAEAFTCLQLANLLWALSPRSSLDSCDSCDSLDTCCPAAVQPPCSSLLPLVEEGQRLDGEQQLVWPQQQAQQLKWQQQHHHQLYDKLGEAVLQGLQGSHLMPRLQQASRAAPPHPSSSSSSVAATHSRSGHGTRSTSPLAGLPPSLPAPPPSPASPLPSNPLFRGSPQPSPLPTPLAQRSSTCLVQLLWAFASHEHCQAALLCAAAPVLSARILQGQLSSRCVACVAWAYARLQQLEPRLLSAILRHSMAHAEQYELRYWARLAWAFSTLGLASEEAYHQRLARLMQERQQQLQRPTPAAGAAAAAQRPSRLQQRGRGHTAAPAARPGAGQGPRGGLECADEQDRMGRSRAQSQLLLYVTACHLGTTSVSFPGSNVYLLLDLDSRRTLRLVCKQLRTSVDGAVDRLDFASSSSCDPDEVLQRLARTSLRPSKLEFCQGLQHQSSHLLNLLAAALSAHELVPVLHGVKHVDEGSLAASTQLTELDGINWFPGLTQLTQLQQLDVHGFFYSGSLPLLATLPQLADLRLQSCLLWPSSQLSRFLFQHLTSLTVGSIHSRDLAALDCPQLQTLSVRQLLVDCEASLRTCANGILQDCSSLCRLLTYDHGQESLRAAADDVRQLGPPPSASALLEALAPWQPRSGKAIEELGLWHLPDVTREALEWLPVNIKSLTFQFCRLMPGALSSVATRLTQLTCLDLTHAYVDSVELQLLAARAQQGDVIDNATAEEPGCRLPYGCLSVPGLAAPTTPVQPYSDPDPPRSASFTWVLLAWAFDSARYHHHQLYDKLGKAVLQGLQGSHLMPRLQQAAT